jgi:hypothetical protein
MLRNRPLQIIDHRATSSKRKLTRVKIVILSKGKVIPVQAVEALRVVRGRGSYIFWTFGSQMAARLSTLRAGRFLPPRMIPGTHFC